jgi:hypothetical protein
MLKPFLRADVAGQDGALQLRSLVRRILDAIPHLCYSIDRGFFHIEHLGSTMTLGFDCFSPEFQTMQDWIEEKRPKGFEGQFEQMLTTWCRKLR